jgi:hypothetical protein
MYTYAANVWDLSIVQGRVSVAPRRTLASRFATLSSLVGQRRAVVPSSEKLERRCCPLVPSSDWPVCHTVMYRHGAAVGMRVSVAMCAYDDCFVLAAAMVFDTTDGACTRGVARVRHASCMLHDGGGCSPARTLRRMRASPLTSIRVATRTSQQQTA